MARGPQQDQWGQGIAKTAGTGALPTMQGDGGNVPTMIQPEQANPLIPTPITANPPKAIDRGFMNNPQTPGGTKPGSSMNPGMRMRQ